MRIMGFKAPHCDTMGNSLEGDRTVGRKRRQLKHFSCPGRIAGWWRKHRRATAGLEPAGADERRPGFGPGWSSDGGEPQHRDTAGVLSHEETRRPVAGFLLSFLISAS